MNFWLMIVFVISTTGICSVNAEWDATQAEKIVEQFSIFFMKMLEFTIDPEGNNKSYAKGYKEAVTLDKRFPARLGVQLDPNYDYFINCTEEYVNFFLDNTVVEFHKTDKILAIKTAIGMLCRNINLDGGILDEYKYANLPFRESLKAFFMEKLKVTVDEFNGYCPEKNPRKSSKGSSKGSSGESSRSRHHPYRRNA